MATRYLVGYVCDLSTGKCLGNTGRLSFKLDAWQPSLFAVLSEKISNGDVVGHLLDAK